VKAPDAKLVLILLESWCLFLVAVAGWLSLRLDYWSAFFVRPEDLAFGFAMKRMGVLIFFCSPLIILLLYTRRIERFRWRERASNILVLTTGLTWVTLGSAAFGSAHADFLDWSEVTLSAAALAGLILVFGGTYLHRIVDKASPRDKGPGANAP
jgi:hypothetical protein